MEEKKEQIDQSLCADQLRLQLLNFVSYNSHSVRAPLSRVLGLADLCSNIKELSEENQWVVLELKTSAQELDKVIRNLSVTLTKGLEDTNIDCDEKL